MKLTRIGKKSRSKSGLKVSERGLLNGLCGIIFEGECEETQIKYHPAQVLADESDTWGHGINGFHAQKGYFKVGKITVLERGPIRGSVRVESSYGNSTLIEEFVLFDGEDFVEQRVYLDWRKEHAVVKLRYSHGCTDPRVWCEIPYCAIERPISRDEVPGGAWAFVQDGKRGLGIINDSKYSYSSDEKFCYLLAARSPLYAHHVPPHVVRANEKLRFLDQGEQEFNVRIVLGKRDWRGADMPRRALEFLQPVVAHLESAHHGAFASSGPQILVSAPNVLITAIKREYEAESGGIVIRAIETVGDESLVHFSSSLFAVSWEAHFRPFELKSFLISGPKISEINGLEDAV